MTIIVCHGDKKDQSLATFEQKVQQYRQRGVKIISLDAKKITPAQLEEALSQDDFFANPKLVTLTNLLIGPKSKARDQLIHLVKTASGDVIIWEGKKVTSTAIKSLGNVQNLVTSDDKSIWELMSLIEPDNKSARFIEKYQQTVNQAASASDPGIYILATLLWHTQMLLDSQMNNYHGIPFKRLACQNQAKKFTPRELADFYRQLIWLDYRAKSGQLALPLSQELLLFLAGVTT
ncbi:hypothetical protein IJJ08_01535 [bacterium]|nr:hypothetical protein [bacterium]